PQTPLKPQPLPRPISSSEANRYSTRNRLRLCSVQCAASVHASRAAAAASGYTPGRTVAFCPSHHIFDAKSETVASRCQARSVAMKGIYSGTVLAVVCVAGLPSDAAGFVPAPGRARALSRSEFPTSAFHPSALNESPVIVKANGDGGVESSGEELGFLSGIQINPPYLLAYVFFLGFAFLRTAAEPEGASAEPLQQFLADPLNPGFNELFFAIWNLLGLFFVPFACLLMPGARGQKLPATPFLLGSMFGGYGVLGLYASARTPDPSPMSRDDLGWFTANVLENKLFNYFILLAFASAYVSSGVLEALVGDPGRLLKEFGEQFSGTAIVSASSVDFLILTLSAASFVPEDLSRRGYKGDLAPTTIAAMTTLLPGVGIALYCALRPSLDEE
ncbi:hypothetical protein ACHAWF_018290, partial [Thalassiosira exigua]